jgi:hypothetical protein
MNLAPISRRSFLRYSSTTAAITVALAAGGCSFFTGKAVTKLEKLEEIAGNKDKTFFRYVVLQENLQAKALTLLGKGKYPQAAFNLNDFVVKYDT